MAKRKIVSQTTSVDPSKVGRTRPAGTRHEYQGTFNSDWYCNSCGNQDPISGSVKVCPACGNPKDSSETYVQPKQKRPYLTAQQMANQGVDLDHGSDEECPFCHYRVAPKTEVCPNCSGTIKDVGKTSRYCPGCGRETNSMSCPSCGSDTKSKSAPVEYPRLDIAPPPPPSKTPFIVGGLAIMGLVALIFLLVSIFSPKTSTGSVSYNNWACSVPVQENQYNQHGGWSLPNGADLVSSGEKFHHNDQVYVRTDQVCEDKWEKVGSHEEPTTYEDCDTESVYVDTTTTCYDDGTCDDVDNYEDVTTCVDVPTTETIDDYDWVERCEPKKIYRDVPVNQTWYEYRVWEWVSISPLVSTGSDNNIVCPLVQVSDTIKQGGEPTKSCDTTFIVNDEPKLTKPNCITEFPHYTEGSNWQVTTSAGVITKVEPLP